MLSWGRGNAKPPPDRLPSALAPASNQVMRLLVSGANGFLAQAVKAVLPHAWHVVGLARGTQSRDAFPMTYHTIESLLARETTFDGVMHLAAQVCDPASGPAGFLPSNVDLCSTLVQAFPTARHVLASSVSVYGPPGAGAVTIATACRPELPYGRSKLAAECVIGVAPDHAVIRFSSLLGRGMKPQTFVPRIIDDARTRKRITLLGNGERLQNYLDVRDAAAMCLTAMQADGHFVTLGVGSRSWSNREMAEMVASRLGAEIIHSGTDDSSSSVYSMNGCLKLGHTMRPIGTTLDWLVER